VMVGCTWEEADWYKRYFAEYGFALIDSAEFSASDCQKLYGVESRLRSYRMQNGEVDSHGLLRILAWEKPLGRGLGYAPPETIGQRLAVMRTEDIFRLTDIYQVERQRNEALWLPIEPIFDDLYDMTDQEVGFFNRPVGVRETGVYGEKFNHVFFQRYGYQIPGYGTIGEHSNLRCSEFTHHDFMIKGNVDELTAYYSEALGMKPEQEAMTYDGDWRKGPKRVFDMQAGQGHYYRGFVSPNNICGKLKFFAPRFPKADLSEEQKIGKLGITLHSLYTPKLPMVAQLLKQQSIKISKIQKNEFGERSIVFTGPDGANWQIIERKEPPTFPVKTKVEFSKTRY